MAIHITLVSPEIPPNTGNISRLCAATNTVLHLVEPLGFSLEDRQLKRAGLDYWHLLQVQVHKNWSSFLESTVPSRRFYIETKGLRSYHQVSYQNGDYLIFGSETKGLPTELLQLEPESILRIPIISGARSLNLASSVAIVLFEALRQLDYPDLSG